MACSSTSNISRLMRVMRHEMFSCSKTFTSMLIGIAQGKKLLRLQDTVRSFFPDIAVEHPSTNLDAMTIRDLLMMGTGHAKDTWGALSQSGQEDWAQVFLNCRWNTRPARTLFITRGNVYALRHFDEGDGA